MMRPSTRSAVLGAAWVFGFGCGDRVRSPPANAAISNVAGSVTLPLSVQCDGPADEVALLAGICGSDTSALSWSLTDAPAGMATAIGPRTGPFFLLYDRLDHSPNVNTNVAGDAKYAAFVFFGQGGDGETTLDAWTGAETVSSGAVVTQAVEFLACSTDWIGQGTFVWRATKLTFAWSATEPC